MSFGVYSFFFVRKNIIYLKSNGIYFLSVRKMRIKRSEYTYFVFAYEFGGTRVYGSLVCRRLNLVRKTYIFESIEIKFSVK